jgi:hypothetical protein
MRKLVSKTQSGNRTSAPAMRRMTRIHKEGCLKISGLQGRDPSRVAQPNRVRGLAWTRGSKSLNLLATEVDGFTQGADIFRARSMGIHSETTVLESQS